MSWISQSENGEWVAKGKTCTYSIVQKSANDFAHMVIIYGKNERIEKRRFESIQNAKTFAKFHNSQQ